MNSGPDNSMFPVGNGAEMLNQRVFCVEHVQSNVFNSLMYLIQKLNITIHELLIWSSLAIPCVVFYIVSYL